MTFSVKAVRALALSAVVATFGIVGCGKTPASKTATKTETKTTEVTKTTTADGKTTVEKTTVEKVETKTVKAPEGGSALGGGTKLPPKKDSENN